MLPESLLQQRAIEPSSHISRARSRRFTSSRNSYIEFHPCATRGHWLLLLICCSLYAGRAVPRLPEITATISSPEMLREILIDVRACVYSVYTLLLYVLYMYSIDLVSTGIAA